MDGDSHRRLLVLSLVSRVLFSGLVAVRISHKFSGMMIRDLMGDRDNRARPRHYCRRRVTVSLSPKGDGFGEMGCMLANRRFAPICLKLRTPGSGKPLNSLAMTGIFEYVNGMATMLPYRRRQWGWGPCGRGRPPRPRYCTMFLWPCSCGARPNRPF